MDLSERKQEKVVPILKKLIQTYIPKGELAMCPPIPISLA